MIPSLSQCAVSALQGGRQGATADMPFPFRRPGVVKVRVLGTATPAMDHQQVRHTSCHSAHAVLKGSE